MRNLLSLAIAFAVVLTENDVLELGYNATEEEFRSYFEIPEDAVAGTYKHAEGFTPESLVNFMNAEESATLAPVDEVGNPAEATPETADPNAKPETAAAKKKREAAEKKAADKAAKDAAKAATPAVAAEPKKPGVIASILEVITSATAPVSDSDILAELITRFPDRTPEAMLKTIKAQLGGKNQPLRMEDEKKVAFKLSQTVVKEGEKSARLYEIAK